VARQPYSRRVSEDERLRPTAARPMVEQTEIVRLSIQGQRQIAAAILGPPSPTPAFKRAAKRYREMFGVA
jgi:uncharacterized protein (DUF1778 family)